MEFISGLVCVGIQGYPVFKLSIFCESYKYLRSGANFTNNSSFTV